MKSSTIFLFSFLCFVLNFTANAQTKEDSSGSEKIRINQIGFYPEGPKKAIIVTSEAIGFFYSYIRSKN